MMNVANSVSELSTLELLSRLTKKTHFSKISRILSFKPRTFIEH